MNDKELYQQKRQAQLDEWRAEVAKFKAKASGASADAQLELNRQIETLEGRIEECKSRLGQIGNAGEDAWDSIKDGVESAWDSMKSALGEAVRKFDK
jgi:chromosome segregation ATPase